MAQTTNVQQPQFKVYGADSVKFTVTNVDDELKQITVSINCSELSTQPEDIVIDAWNLNTDEPVRLQIAKMVFDAVLLQKNLESDSSAQMTSCNTIKSQEQTVTATELETHLTEMHKLRNNHFDPLLTESRITTIFHEDDFDFQFENLMKELNE
mgnify:CR=1 FL=1|tara:strand:+ start:657 stop:1118 length:462 start_codon:yes stop_codon:yes gene_type:complete